MQDRLLTRVQVRDLDRRAIEEFGIPGSVLMENAGRGAAELLCSLGISGPVVICCGKGNNAGDGFVIARHLAIRSVRVHVLLFANPDELRGDAAANYHTLSQTAVSIEHIKAPQFDQPEFASADWLVDALFGTGLTAAVRPPYDGIIAAMNRSRIRTLAVDVPSGLDCDTGNPLGPCIQAAHTATFAAVKMGFVQPEAQPWVGKVHCIDIGIPQDDCSRSL